MCCPSSLYSNGFEMKRKIILGLLSFLGGSAYAADIRMNNNNPLNTRGTVEKAYTNKTKTIMSLGINAFSEIRNESDSIETSNRESILSVSHSVLNNLDLGVSYIYNSETNRNNEDGKSDSFTSNNLSIGAKYQAIETRLLSAGISAYVESGYGELESYTSSSKSKASVAGLVSIFAGNNFAVNMSTGYKYYNNARFENYQMYGEFSEAISFQTIYKSFDIEAYFKARQLSALNLTTTNTERLTGLLYGASASADLELANIAIYAEFPAEDSFGVASSSYGMNISVNLDTSRSSKRPAPTPELSTVEEKEEETDVDVKAGIIDDDAIRFKDYKEDPSLIMKNHADDVDREDSDSKDLTEYKKLKKEREEFKAKYGNIKTEYEKIEEETKALRKQQAIEDKKREKEERIERERARKELAKKIAAEKKFNEKINEKLNEEVKEQFKQDEDWEKFDGLDDKGQRELDDLDELDKELAE